MFELIEGTKHVCPGLKSEREPSKSTRVDIDATGRKALDLGPSWEWQSAEWKGQNLHIIMARKMNGVWGPQGPGCAVKPADFIYEVEG